MRTITYFPLTVVLAYWTLWASSRTRYTSGSQMALSERIVLMEYLRGALPVPITRYQRIVVRAILVWIDGEIRRAHSQCNALPELNG